MFTHPQLVQRHKNEKPRLVTPTIVDYPALFFKSIRVVCLIYSSLVSRRFTYWFAFTDLDGNNRIHAPSRVRSAVVVSRRLESDAERIGRTSNTCWSNVGPSHDRLSQNRNLD